MPVRRIVISVCASVGIVVLSASTALAQAAPASSDLVPIASGPDSPEAQKFLSLISEAARRHPDFGEALARVGENRGTLDEVRSVRYPQVEAGLDTVSSLTNRTSVGGEEQRIPSQSVLRQDAVISVSQLIFDAGSSYHRVSAVKARTGAAQAVAAETLNDVALRSLAAYFDVLRYRLAVRIAEENLDQHRLLTGWVVKRTDTGAGSRNDVLRATSRSNEAEAQLILANGELQRSEAAYFEMFGLLPGTLPPPLLLPRATFDETRALELALLQNASVEAARRQVEAARDELAAERLAAYPSVTLEVNGRQFDITSFDDLRYDVGARLVVRYKLYSGGAERGRRERASAQLRQARHRQDARRLTVERLVTSSLADIAARRERERAFGLTVAANVSARDANEALFSLGRTSFMDLLDVQRELFTARLQWLNAIVDLYLAQYSMAAVTGDLLPFFGLEKLAHAETGFAHDRGGPLASASDGPERSD